jgi:hypothetical protein
MGKGTAEQSNEGVAIPQIIIDKCEEKVIRRTRQSLKHRSRSSEAIKIQPTDTDTADPSDGSRRRPQSASVLECASRLSEIDRVVPKRSCSFSSICSKDEVCSCSCQDSNLNLKTTDGVNGQNMVSFYKLWKRNPVNDIVSKSKLEPPSSMRRSDKYRHCGCFTREHARKLAKSPCRCH